MLKLLKCSVFMAVHCVIEMYRLTLTMSLFWTQLSSPINSKPGLWNKYHTDRLIDENIKVFKIQANRHVYK